MMQSTSLALLFVIGTMMVSTHQDFSTRIRTWDSSVWTSAPPSFILPSDRTLRLKVKSCDSASVALVNRGRQLYQVDLGRMRDGVMEVTLYKQWSNIPKVMLARSTTNLLDCDSFRSFWVTWVDGIFKVGFGDGVGQHMIISAVDPRPFIIYNVKFRSGEGSFAVWLI